MFFSSFFRAFQPAILAKPQNTRQRYYFFRTYASAKRIFLIKSHNLPLFALFFAFSTVLTRATYRALPDLQRSELPTTARSASDLQGSARSTAKRTTIYSSPCEQSTGLCPIYSEAIYQLQLALRAIYRAPPDLQRSELPSTARPASDLLSPATNSLSTTLDIR